MSREDAVARLLAIMARLRAPEGGCPWDLAQDFESIAPYTIEEAYEVSDAIASGSPGKPAPVPTSASVAPVTNGAIDRLSSR